MFERKIFSKLEAWKNRAHRCLVLKGPPRIGKTSVAEHFGRTAYSNYMMLDLLRDPLARRILEENDTVDSIVDAASLYKGIDITPGKSLIILDEIHCSPLARSKLRLFSEDGRYDVIAIGSMLDVSDARLGRYRKGPNPHQIPVGSEESLTMHPMDFEEFLLATGMKRKNIDAVRDKIRTGKALTDTESELFDKRFAAYSVVGGLPEAVDAFVRNGANGAQKVLKEISSSYADAISDYNSGHDVKKTQQCYCSVPRQLCDTNKRFTYARIDDGGSRCSAEKYGMNLHWLERSGYCVLSRSLSALNRPLGKYTSKDAFKAYMSDSGLLMSMMSAESRVEALMGDTSFDFGAVTENAVAGCLSKCGYGLSYYRRTNGMDKMEIDSVIDCDGLVCIEVKTGAEREYPSLRKTLNDPNVSRRVIFEKGNILTDEDGIEHYPLFAAAFLFPENEQIVDDSELSGMFGDPFTE